MLTQFRTTTTRAPLASPDELDALGTLMVEDEAVVSDAPTYRPEAQGTLLLAGLLLLAPKQPKEKGR
ncbi:hypothetical protein [Streptomyces rubellomurinus]|uniref:Uncharacterized protein n=2 Tax=Streptomyces TaxID=1883 RepID=A0A0F2TKE3_STRR3|nr:hypothetical protein [Streptomyces rubellomurinus]KJS56145.1 hypothetical protein VM98_08770 [Streptomyces rubellomurinus subsp. indigoferus]KJS62755.1 hypothetical protein VM95_07225 [Streptomyces rubellomurinus]